MRSAFAVSLAALLLLASIASVAQSEKKDSDGLVARLSYQSGGMVIDWRYQKGYPHICFAVYRSGYYRVLRFTEQGNQTLEGMLPKEQLAGLDQVLDKIDFQSQGAGVQYLQGAESLVVEIVRHRETKRYFWINPEHRNPLPKSATKLVDWLESFQAPGATPFSYHEPTDIRICPSMNENPLPIMSSSNYESSSITCGGQIP